MATTTYDTLTRAEKIERVSSEIYTRLAESFAGDPSVSTMFQEFAREEVQHAARIHLLRSQYQSSPGLFARMERLEEELGAMEAFLFGLRDQDPPFREPETPPYVGLAPRPRAARGVPARGSGMGPRPAGRAGPAPKRAVVTPW